MDLERTDENKKIYHCICLWSQPVGRGVGVPLKPVFKEGMNY